MAGASQPLPPSFARSRLSCAARSAGTSPSCRTLKKKQRHVITQGNPERLKLDVGVHHGNELVALRMPLGLKRRRNHPQVPLRTLLRTEGKPAHPGMASFGAYDQIVAASPSAVERGLDLDTVDLQV